jgi:uracil-DNA glycosylase
MLWGTHAQQKAPLLAVDGIRPKLLLQCNHPSPLSATRPPAPFIGCSHFSQANAFLAASGRGPVDWRLP